MSGWPDSPYLAWQTTQRLELCQWFRQSLLSTCGDNGGSSRLQCYFYAYGRRFAVLNCWELKVCHADQNRGQKQTILKPHVFLLRSIWITLFVVASVSAAEPIEGDRFSIRLGIFLTDRDTDTQLNSSEGNGSNTDPELPGLDAESFFSASFGPLAFQYPPDQVYDSLQPLTLAA